MTTPVSSANSSFYDPTTVLGAIPGLALAFWEGVECGKDLRAYYDCENP